MTLLKKALLLGCLCIGFSNILKAQQTLVCASVIMNNGTESTYTFDETAIITFPTEDLLVITQNGTETEISLPEVRKITFSNVLGNNEESASSLSILPNPAHDKIAISGINSPSPMTIYSAEGKKIMNSTIYDGQTIDISTLHSGLYYVNINNKNLKLIKL